MDDLNMFFWLKGGSHQSSHIYTSLKRSSVGKWQCFDVCHSAFLHHSDGHVAVPSAAYIPGFPGPSSKRWRVRLTMWTWPKTAMTFGSWNVRKPKVEESHPWVCGLFHVILYFPGNSSFGELRGFILEPLKQIQDQTPAEWSQYVFLLSHGFCVFVDCLIQAGWEYS